MNETTRVFRITHDMMVRLVEQDPFVTWTEVHLLDLFGVLDVDDLAGSSAAYTTMRAFLPLVATSAEETPFTMLEAAWLGIVFADHTLIIDESARKALGLP